MMRFRDDINVFAGLPERDADLYALLRRCGELAGRRWQVYAVGGLVRDALLGMVNRDVDIVVLDDAEGYAQRLAEALTGRLTVHAQFHTATVDLEKISLDIVLARREKYAFPGALPEVFGSTLEDDLRRRDFTANSLAASLNCESFGILAECGGYDDLLAGTLRVWHSRSFVDDPTRIFRAVKYMSRCSWKMAEDTQTALDAAVASGALHTVSGVRIGRELKLILREKAAASCLEELQRCGVLAALDLPIQDVSEMRERLRRAGEYAAAMGSIRLREAERAQLYLNVLLSGCAEKTALQLLEKWSFSSPEKEAYRRSRQTAALGGMLTDGRLSLAERAYELRNKDLVCLAALACCRRDAQISEVMSAYLAKWHNMLPLADGRALKALGITPGPRYQQLLRKLWIAQAEGRIRTAAEARGYLSDLAGTEICSLGKH